MSRLLTARSRGISGRPFPADTGRSSPSPEFDNRHVWNCGSARRICCDVITLAENNMDSNRFSRIIIVDSIPKGERNTAEELRDDLRTAAAANPPAPSIEYERVESADELLRLLTRLRDDVRGGSSIPMLHIECHGDGEGFGMADDSLIDWPDLKQPFTDLNVATELNLFVSVAACTGGAIAKVISMGDRAPLWGLVGPTKPMYPSELSAAFGTLFRTLLQTKSAAGAFQAMEATSAPGTYWCASAQGLFEKGWQTYMAQHSTPEALELRAVRMTEALQKLRPPPYPSLEELKLRVKRLEPISYDRYVRTFFMHDLYPSHSARFPLKFP